MTVLTATGSTVLNGGGLITLSNSAFNLITGTAGAVLTNVDNIISGAGSISGVGLINQAAGAINGDQTLPLILNLFGTAVNQGLLEATHGGTLKLSGNIDNTGGQILADGGRVILGGVTITNGALLAGLQSAFVVEGIGNTLIGGGLNGIDLSGGVTLYGDAVLTIEGALNNFGELLIKTGKGASTTDLIVGAPGVILGGGGQIVLSSLSSVITGFTSGSTLNNLDNLITGSGLLGNGLLTLINGVEGTILGSGGNLIIDTGTNSIANAGLIGASGGRTVVGSVIDNSGVLESEGGALTVLGAVTGSGQGIVNGGVLSFASSFAQNVIFQGAGILRLAHSQGYTGTISGFSNSGATSLDLKDIRFVGSGEATYNGNASGGVLTVSDGRHTTRISMVGDYVGSTFTASSDGHGGTIVTDHAGPGASVLQFTAAAAGLETRSAASSLSSHDWRPSSASTLARPMA